MMRRYIHIILYSVLGGIVCLLFYVCQNVQTAQDNLTLIKKQILQEQEKIRVYHAEWAFLTNPERLQNMAQKYTQLSPITGSSIVSIKQIPFPSKDAPSDDLKDEDSNKPSITLVDYQIQSSDIQPYILNKKFKNSGTFNKSAAAESMRVSIAFKDIWGGQKK